MSTRIEALRLIEIITDDLTGNSGIFSTTLQSKPTGSATDTHGPATTTGDTTSPRSGTDLCQFMQTSPSGNPGNFRASLGGDNLHNVHRSNSVVTRKVTGYPPSHQPTSVPTSNWFAALSVLTQSPNGDELADTRHDSQSHTVDHQHSPTPRGKTPSPQRCIRAHPIYSLPTVNYPRNSLTSLFILITLTVGRFDFRKTQHPNRYFHQQRRPCGASHGPHCRPP